LLGVYQMYYRDKLSVSLCTRCALQQPALNLIVHILLKKMNTNLKLNIMKNLLLYCWVNYFILFSRQNEDWKNHENGRITSSRD
jgi:hypothetical protein